MRSLKSIFSGGNRTVLFQEGKWCIYRRERDKCYIIHRCAMANKSLSHDGSKCHACGAVLPKALQGLFFLHEWKR